jgi:hypothetical protein
MRLIFQMKDPLPAAINARVPAADLPESFAVSLLGSDNQYLTYPVAGRLQIIEAFANGTIHGAFQKGQYDGCFFYADGGPVMVRRPRFTHME